MNKKIVPQFQDLIDKIKPKLWREDEFKKQKELEEEKAYYENMDPNLKKFHDQMDQFFFKLDEDTQSLQEDDGDSKAEKETEASSTFQGN
mmetsp:Transcript_8540/g.14402  ORF Transcript_8540/g.14402 Transcript_8540/m.14402 type:complete len:90 (+) Transcript_8540:473-742(+)